jgi:hypothetical protein
VSTHPRERVRTLTVTTAANTPSSSPQVTTWSIGRGVVDRIDIVIPDGHAGLTGIALLWGGRQVVPYEDGEWIVGNDDEVTVALDLYVHDSLEVLTYNEDDTFAHSHLLRVYVVGPGPEEELLAVPSVIPSAPGAGTITPPGGTVPGELPPPEEVPTEGTPTEEGGAPSGEGTTEGPHRIEVPDVVGKRLERARRILRDAGLRVEVHRVESDEPRGRVISQRPRAGHRVAPGTIVALRVSGGS